MPGCRRRAGRTLQARGMHEAPRRDRGFAATDDGGRRSWRAVIRRRSPPERPLSFGSVGAARGSRRGRGRILAASLGCAAALAGAAGSMGALPVGPTPTSAPIVIGIAAAGKRLTGLSGVWTGSGAILYRYQWFRCNAAGAECLSIGGATSPTYTLV